MKTCGGPQWGRWEIRTPPQRKGPVLPGGRCPGGTRAWMAHWKLEIYEVPWLSSFGSDFQRILHRPDRGYLSAGCTPRHRERTPSGSAHGRRGRLHSLLPWQGSGRVSAIQDLIKWDLADSESIQKYLCSSIKEMIIPVLRRRIAFFLVIRWLILGASWSNFLSRSHLHTLGSYAAPRDQLKDH